jgi:hypothetical protein
MGSGILPHCLTNPEQTTVYESGRAMSIAAVGTRGGYNMGIMPLNKHTRVGTRLTGTRGEERPEGINRGKIKSSKAWEETPMRHR